MSDYSETFTKVDGNTIEAADFETEFQAIETAVATKLDKATFQTGYAGGALKQGTVQSTAAGTAVTFTGLPSWTKRITIQLDGVSCDTAGTDLLSVTLGTSSGLEVTGYDHHGALIQGSGTSVTTSTGNNDWRICYFASASTVAYGHAVVSNVDGDDWIISSNSWAGSQCYIAGGNKTLAGTLDRISIFLEADNFDAGQINILYEG